ncbi:MAG: carboxypeptidase regulatory-like domain-containing protein, partial [Vicinamibacterales bacterium]
MKQRLVTLVLSVVLTATASAAAFAQGGATSSLSGTVTDASGAVLPGATVVAKHNGTGAVSNAVTADNGTFHIPALNPGTYTVTVSLSGFKTVALNDVVLNVGAPASVRASLELGTIEETIVVEGASPVVQTQASAVATTINIETIKNVPITSRNVLDIVPLLPGVHTPGGNRDSTVLGLQQSAINITLDGVNIQDNTLKTTDGFFTIVQPRLDAIEEVTVTTAAQGADSAGQGAVQIRFVTRSGTNDLHG